MIVHESYIPATVDPNSEHMARLDELAEQDALNLLPTLPHTDTTERRSDVLADIGLYNGTMSDAAQNGFWAKNDVPSAAMPSSGPRSTHRGGRSYPEAGGRDQAIAAGADNVTNAEPTILSPKTAANKAKLTAKLRRSGIARALIAGEAPSVVAGRDTARQSQDGTGNGRTRSRIANPPKRQTYQNPATSGDHVIDMIS